MARTSKKAKDLFIAKLRETGIVARAAKVAGLGRTTVYNIRERDKDFAAAWDDAVYEAIGVVEQSIREMALGYCEREFFDKDGNLTQRVFKRDVRAAQLFLAARVPEYRRAHDVNVNADVKAQATVKRDFSGHTTDELLQLEKLLAKSEAKA